MATAPPIFTYMSPHWLDEPFGQGAGEYNATYWAITRNSRFCSAIQKATLAYQETKRAQDDAQRQGHMIAGPGPEQAARSAFLHEINQDDVDRTGYGAAPPN